jgi:type IV pilus assembly protein PilA
MKNFFRKANDKGLTLIELLVTIILVGVVASIAIPIVANSVANATASANEETSEQLQLFVERWDAAEAEYEKSGAGVVSAKLDGRVMETIKDDPTKPGSISVVGGVASYGAGN